MAFYASYIAAMILSLLSVELFPCLVCDERGRAVLNRVMMDTFCFQLLAAFALAWPSNSLPCCQLNMNVLAIFSPLEHSQQFSCPVPYI